eukprot:m.446582 g.446582  ORF g.446582 m.446582 type:complete len:241 (+) comp19393_c0_seq1:391-1113(+)
MVQRPSRPAPLVTPNWNAAPKIPGQRKSTPIPGMSKPTFEDAGLKRGISRKGTPIPCTKLPWDDVSLPTATAVRRPTPIPTTPSVDWDDASVDISTPPLSASEPTVKLARALLRRPESVVRMAERWGVSMEDAVDLCDAVDSKRAHGDDSLRPASRRRLSFAAPTGAAAERESTPDASPLFAPRRFSFSRPQAPSPACTTDAAQDLNAQDDTLCASPLFSPGVVTLGRPQAPTPNFLLSS